MLFIDEIRKGIDIMLHPSKATKESKDIGGIFTYYYKLSFIPLILMIIVLLALLSIIRSIIGSTSLIGSVFAGLGILGAILYPIAILWVLIPVGFLVSAGLLQIFGKLVRQFKADYIKTLNAVIYGSVPLILFYWIFMVPLLGGIVEFIMAIWGLIVLIIALSNQQKIGNGASFGILILTGVVVGIIVGVIAIAFSVALFHSILPAINSSAIVTTVH